ncbi:rod shape-determining protein RodA [bacterium]|nr:rod shape-determining protein RodA [bacterium]
MMGFIDRRSIFNFDLVLLGLTVILTSAGIYTIHIAGAGNELSQQFYRQLIWFSLGLACLLIIITMDYHFWSNFAYAFYALSIILLIVLLYKGSSGQGVDRWIKIGFLPPIQPSEFLKIALIMTLAKYFSTQTKSILKIKDLIVPGILGAVPFFCVMAQPDLGTALSLIPICLVLILVAGYRFRDLVKWGLIMIVPGLLMARYALKPYQIRRLTSFLNPQADVQGSGWHAVMSKISVGSGGIIGKVGEEPRLYQRGFLPEQHTDFIFSVWAEETGFLGSLIIILLFVLLLRRCLLVALEAKDTLGIYLAIGILTMIGFQAFYNMGMVMGVLPITGLPLPFFSYGGSHMLTTYISIGLLLNIRMRRYMF